MFVLRQNSSFLHLFVFCCWHFEILCEFYDWGVCLEMLYGLFSQYDLRVDFDGIRMRTEKTKRLELKFNQSNAVCWNWINFWWNKIWTSLKNWDRQCQHCYWHEEIFVCEKNVGHKINMHDFSNLCLKNTKNYVNSWIWHHYCSVIQLLQYLECRSLKQ